MMKILQLQFLLFTLLSCGGGSGGGGNSNNNAPEPVERESIVGEDFGYENNRYQATVNDVEFISEVDYHNNGQPRLIQSLEGEEPRVYIAIEGENVRGFGGSYENKTEQSSDFSFFGIQGEVSSTTPTGIIIYEGSYARADVTKPSRAVIIRNIQIEGDFNSNSFSGQSTDDIEGIERIVISGQMENETVTLIISDIDGTHEAKGRLFGPNGEEIASGYVDGTLVGMIYGHQS